MLDRMNQTQTEQQQECNCDLSGSCENCPYVVFDDVEVDLASVSAATKLVEDMCQNFNNSLKGQWSGKIVPKITEGKNLSFVYKSHVSKDSEESLLAISGHINRVEREFFGFK